MKVRVVGNVTIVDIKGSITLRAGSTDLKEMINSLKEQGQIKVVLNLANTEYIDSTGIAVLVSGFTSLSRVGGSLKLMSCTKRILDFIKITKLYTIFKNFESEEEAVKSFE